MLFGALLSVVVQEVDKIAMVRIANQMGKGTFMETEFYDPVEFRRVNRGYPDSEIDDWGAMM